LALLSPPWCRLPPLAKAVAVAGLAWDIGVVQELIEILGTR